MKTFSSVKPKTQSDIRNVYMNKKDLVLDFKSSRVICPDILEFSTESSVLSQKDFFDLKLDEACSLQTKDIGLCEVEDDLYWDEFPVNILDVGAFNAPASAGEDLFWAAELILSKKSMKMRVAGLVFYMEYKMAKILDFIEEDVVIPIDYPSFYYLNQLFKKVTKTKPKNLMVHLSEDRVYFTCDDSEYCIVIFRKHGDFKVIKGHLDIIKKRFEEEEYVQQSKSLDRVQYAKEQDSTFKHTCKVLGATISHESSNTIDKYYDANGVLYLTKEKENV